MTTGEGKDWNGNGGQIKKKNSLKPPAAVLPRGWHVYLCFRVYR